MQSDDVISAANHAPDAPLKRLPLSPAFRPSAGIVEYLAEKIVGDCLRHYEQGK